LAPDLDLSVWAFGAFPPFSSFASTAAATTFQVGFGTRLLELIEKKIKERLLESQREVRPLGKERKRI
jgi:hypothetical protein